MVLTSPKRVIHWRQLTFLLVNNEPAIAIVLYLMVYYSVPSRLALSVISSKSLGPFGCPNKGCHPHQRPIVRSSKISNDGGRMTPRQSCPRLPRHIRISQILSELWWSAAAIVLKPKSNRASLERNSLYGKIFGARGILSPVSHIQWFYCLLYLMYNGFNSIIYFIIIYRGRRGVNTSFTQFLYI